MTSSFRLHKIVALIVLIAAAIWIATGEFAAVGSQEASGAEAPAAAPAPAAGEVTLRTVGGVVPMFTDHSRRIRLSGATEANKRAVLAARADGVIQKLSLTKGDAVEEGTVVMALEGPEAAAQARIAQVALEQRERELDVAAHLFAGGNTPEIQLTSARSARDAAEAQLTLARATVDRLQLSAPFTGLVDSVDVELGEWVQTGTPIATILSLDPILVHAEVSEMDVGQVMVGAKANVRLVNGTQMEGMVRFVARDASTETRTFPVEIALPNPDGMIPAGMTAEVDLFTAPERSVAVPRSVITLSAAGDVGLRVAGPDDVAHFVPVTIVDDTADGLVVTGVPEGVRIIVAGQDLVRDGEKVLVADVSQGLK